MTRVPRSLTVLLVALLAACSSAPAAETSPTASASAAPPSVAATPTAEPSDAAPSATPIVTTDITDLVEAVREQAGLPAMAGAIVTKDGILAIGASGIRRAGGSTPVTTEDMWHIGSNLKAITAALAAIAVDDGVIEWTTTIAEAYPELGDAVRAEYRDVTLLQLLAMQGGLQGSPPAGTNPTGTTRQQRDAAVAAGLGQPPYGPAGSFYYSNLSYVTAASMVERAMGSDYEDLLAERLADPVGATHIGWGPTTPSGDAQPVGHSLANGAWTPCDGCDNPPWLSAAGRAHMPLADWAALIGELMRAVDGESAIISADAAETLVTGHTRQPGTTDQYGLGWNVTRRPWGGVTVTHEGSNTFNNSVVWIGLEAGVAFLAVTNAADLDGGSTPAALDDLVARLLSWYQAQ